MVSDPVWAGQVLATVQTLDPGRAVAWAVEEIMQTEDPQVFFAFCDVLHARGMDLATIPGFVDRLRNLFLVPGNRSMPSLYDLIRRYQVTEASGIIAEDLLLILGPEARERNMPVWDMYETLAALPVPEGHGSLIQHVRVCPAHHRLPILEYLSQYRPELAQVELPNHLSDAELDIREGAERLPLSLHRSNDVG